MEESFDPRKWRRRATQAFKQTNNARRFMRDCGAICHLIALIDWANAQGLKVTFDEKPVAWIEGRHVRVNRVFTPERQLFLLAHECGHWLIIQQDKKQQLLRFKHGHAAPPSAAWLHRIDVLDEEFEAWDRGWRLMERLGIRADRTAFDACRVEQLKTHLKWALRVDGYGGDDEEEKSTHASARRAPRRRSRNYPSSDVRTGHLADGEDALRHASGASAAVA